MTKKLLMTLIATTFSCGAVFAQAAGGANDADSSLRTPAVMTTPSQDAKDAKTHSKAEYKARKKIADANKDLNKAECETSTDGSVERACKKEARATAKQDKAEAKTTYELEKKQIKDGAKP